MMSPEQAKELEAVQQFKNLYKSVKGKDIDVFELTKILVNGMDYDETYERLMTKSEKIGRMKFLLKQAHDELSFYQKRYGYIVL